ncbi:protein MHF1 homolog [Phragmites australis]|uniref:protein MHF1 homolog n=1 Tax=Phragmites australis TaxID=29695 RepID=UPI002D78E5CE|nr:protein MHF1 homolog [Phragmites australis]
MDSTTAAMETLVDDAAAALAGDSDGEAERYEAEAAEADLLRDRLRLAVIKIATSEGRKAGMEVADPVVACVADLAFKSAEQLAKDVELFAQHAGRKSIKMEDVILTAHRNEHLMGLLRTFSQELKGKEPANERKRKKSSKKDEKTMKENQSTTSMKMKASGPPVNCLWKMRASLCFASVFS